MSVRTVVTCQRQKLLAKLAKWLSDQNYLSAKVSNLKYIGSAGLAQTSIISRRRIILVGRIYPFTEKFECVGHVAPEHVFGFNYRLFAHQFDNMSEALRHNRNCARVGCCGVLEIAYVIVSQGIRDTRHLESVRKRRTPSTQSISAKVKPHQFFVARLLLLVSFVHRVNSQISSGDCRNAGNERLIVIKPPRFVTEAHPGHATDEAKCGRNNCHKPKMVFARLSHIAPKIFPARIVAGFRASASATSIRRAA